MIYHTPPDADVAGGAAVMPIWTIEGETKNADDGDNDDANSVDNYTEAEDDTRILLEKVRKRLSMVIRR